MNTPTEKPMENMQALTNKTENKKSLGGGSRGVKGWESLSHDYSTFYKNGFGYYEN